MFRTLLIAVVAAPLGAYGQARPGTAVTEQGAKTVALMESYLKAPDGTPYPGENAWDQYVNVIAATRECYPPNSCEDDEVPHDVEILYRPGVAEAYRAKGKDPEAIRQKALDTVRAMTAAGVFDRLSALAGERRCLRPPQPGDMIDWSIGEIGTGRFLVRMSAARMKLAADASEWPGLVRNFEHALAVGRIHASQANDLDYVAGVAMQSVAFGQLRRAMSEHAIPAGVLRDAAAAMDRQGPLPPASLPIEAYRLLCLDMVRKIYDDSARTPERALAEQGDGEAGGDEMRLLTRGGGIASKGETIEAFNRVIDRVLEASRLPPREAVAAGAAADASVSKLPRNQYLVPIMARDWERLLAVCLRHQTELAGTRLMLAIEWYRVERGRSPERLAELVPEYLDALPNDPCSGAGFCYQTRDAAYVLYSVGFDGVDNGGVAPPEGKPRADDSRSKPGFDFVLNAAWE